MALFEFCALFAGLTCICAVLRQLTRDIHFDLGDRFSQLLDTTGSMDFGLNQSENVKHSDNIDELKDRIAVLEKIVTEPAYELNQKLNQL